MAVLSPKIKIFQWNFSRQTNRQILYCRKILFRRQKKKKCSRINSEIYSTLNIKFSNQHMFGGRIIIEPYSDTKFYFAAK